MLSDNRGGRRRKGETYGVMAFVFPSNHYTWWSPAFLQMAGHLPADREAVNEFLILLCLCMFGLPIKLSLSEPVNFPFYRFSPPSHQKGVSERLHGA